MLTPSLRNESICKIAKTETATATELVVIFISFPVQFEYFLISYFKKRIRGGHRIAQLGKALSIQVWRPEYNLQNLHNLQRNWNARPKRTQADRKLL